MRLLKSLFFRLCYSPTISYGITVCNEHLELDKLLGTLLHNIDSQDEIVVLRDVTIMNDDVSLVLNKYNNIKVINTRLEGDFSKFKNQLIRESTKDYIFQIDADEVPKLTLLSNIKKMIKQKGHKYDCFLVPRINIVNNISNQDLEKWNWTIDNKKRINFPDYQMRVFRNNGKITWKNKVHEVVTGYKRYYSFPHENEDYCLIHIKEIEKQKKQNELYDKL